MQFEKIFEVKNGLWLTNSSGTTETQRSVSYYRVPSFNCDPTNLEKLGDVIPAGKGMIDVQLLVVDRENRTSICNVGEPGEIYIRVSSGKYRLSFPDSKLSRRAGLPRNI